MELSKLGISVSTIFGVLVIVAVGILVGRVSVERPVIFLPTRIAPTPVNYIEQMEATPETYYGNWGGTATPLPPVTGKLARGQELYQPCIHCHGEFGQGEPNAPNPYIPDQYGYMRVPRHDSLGHTWMHPDQLLVQIIKNGSNNVLYRNIMPPFGEAYTDEEIMILLDYIKYWWTPEQREQQAAATRRLELARAE